MNMKQVLLWLLLIIFIKQSTAQQISYEGKLLPGEVFLLKCVENNKFKVRGYIVSVLDSSLALHKHLTYVNSSDTLSKSDFNTIVWNNIPKGRYYLRFYSIIYTEIDSKNNDEDFRFGNELIISFIKH